MPSELAPLSAEQEKIAIDAVTALDSTTPYSPLRRTLPADWPWPANSRTEAVAAIGHTLSLSKEQSEAILRDLVVKQNRLWERAGEVTVVGEFGLVR